MRKVIALLACLVAGCGQAGSIAAHSDGTCRGSVTGRDLAPKISVTRSENGKQVTCTVVFEKTNKEESK